MSRRGFVTTAAELHKFVGKTGSLTTSTERLTVPVAVLDARLTFGRIDVLVVAAGATSEGAAWVASSRIVFAKEARA